MIRNFLIAGASALALALSVPAFAQDSTDLSDLPEMSFGTWGFDPATLDPEVHPGDDFFAYVNGKWVRENPIPPQFSRFGAFTYLDEKSKVDVQAMIEELVATRHPAGSSEQRIVDAYNAYLDTAAIDERGLAPAYPYLTSIFNAPDLEALAQLFGDPAYPSLIGAGITIDAKDPDSYIPSIGFDGMGLPDRDIYLVDTEKNLEIREKYKQYLAFLLGKAGYSDTAQVAEAVYAFEHQVAELEWARTAMRNRDLTYHRLSRDEVAALAPSYPVLRTLEAAGLGETEYFLAPQLPPSAERAAELGLDEATLAGIGGGLPAMMELLTETPLPTLKAFMAAHFLSSYAGVLPSDLDEARFDFYSRTLNGVEEQQPRWKRAIGTVESQLGEVLGKAYAERHFPPASKDAMDELVENLRKALAVSLEENDWMTPDTKVQAVAKLEAFFPKIGYPDKFEEYEGLEIDAADPLGNAVSAARWQLRKDVGRLGGPMDRAEWFMLPQTVNAYYNPSFNEIVFPAAILQQPFFGPDVDPAINYGAIGGVIGHEMGHGFDDQGSKYSATGKLENWWTDADRAAFDAKGDMLVEQYNQFCPLDEGKTCVNGRLSLGENIGDLSGISLAYRAYKMSLDGKEAPVIDGLTGDQRFFLAWAQVWRSATREDALRQRLMTGPHSPERYRVNGPLRNVDAWYEAFGVTPEHEMYLPPEKRVHIW